MMNWYIIIKHVHNNNDIGMIYFFNDAQVRDFFKTRLQLDDNYLNMIIEDYSPDLLADLL